MSIIFTGKLNYPSFPDIFQFINYFALSIVIVVLLHKLSFNNVIRCTSYVITISVFLVSLIGIFQAFDLLPFYIPSVRLPGSTLIDRPFAAEYVACSIFWIIIAYLYCASPKLKWLFTITLLITLSYLIILKSRTGYLSFIVGTLFFLFFYIKKIKISYFKIKSIPKKTIALILFSIIFIFITTILNPPKTERKKSFFKTIISLYEPNNPRITYWKASFKMFLDNPILGVGTGMWSAKFPKYSGTYLNDENIQKAHVNPHNDFFEILAENGIISFLCYVSFFLMAIYQLVKEKDKISLLLASSIVTILVASCFSFTKDRAATMIVCYTALGASYIDEGKKLKTIYIKLFILFLLFSCSLSAVYYTVKSYYETLLIKGLRQKELSHFFESNEFLLQINTTIYPLRPDQMPIDYLIGINYSKQKEYEKALQHYQKASNFFYNPAILNNIAFCYSKLYHVQRAEEILINLKEEYPNYFEPQINLAILYTKMKKYKKAKLIIKGIELKSNYFLYEEGYRKNYWWNVISFKKNVRTNNSYNNLLRFYIQNTTPLLIRHNSKKDTYLIEHGKKRKFANEMVLNNSGYDTTDILYLPPQINFSVGNIISN